MTLVFTADDVMKTEKNDISLCKLDVDIKNQVVVIDSVGFFNLTRNSLKEKV